MLRSLAARSFSARQKSQLRSLAFRLGRYKLRDVEAIVDSLVLNDGAQTFLQIGANDGYLSDPLNLAIFRHRLRGTFVEPQANYFSALRDTYRSFSDMQFVQKAITSQAGSMTMYSLDCSSGKLPRWAHGVGTLSREQIRKSGDQIPDIESYIRTQNVQCCTVRDLLGDISERDPDIIVVDAEGFDHAILCQFDFGSLSTKLVIYETESMDVEDARRLAAGFGQAGFAVFDAGQDTIALRTSTAAFEAMQRPPAPK